MAHADPSVRSAAYSIVAAIVADRVKVLDLAGDVTRWIAEHDDEVGDHPIAWTASRAVRVALDALESGDAAALRADQVELLRSLPTAAQVAVALHHFVSLDLDDV